MWREAVGPYARMIPDHGVDMVVAEASVRYRASARFDDEVDVVATIVRLGTTSMTTAITVERVADGALLAEGELRHVYVDPGTQEKSEMPAAIRTGLGRFAAATAVQ
jgi:acyl-CoA thioester hydrolase